MDLSQLKSLKRPQLQQLARRESLKANLKNVDIVRLLLEKHPDGVPELTEISSVSKHSQPSPSKAKQPVRRSKRKPAAKPKPFAVKIEESHPNVHVETALNEPGGPRKRRDARSMAPPPTTPVTPPQPLQLSVNRRLPTTPRIDVFVEKEAGGGAVGARDVSHLSAAIPTLPEAAAVTSHRAREMLRSLTDIVDATSFLPEEPSSILYRAKALSALLDTAVLPRVMKVDKDVKDLVWMRVALESSLGSRLKEEGVLPDRRPAEVVNIRSDLSFPTARPQSHKRPREEEDGEEATPSSQPRASKRTRVQ